MRHLYYGDLAIAKHYFGFPFWNNLIHSSTSASESFVSLPALGVEERAPFNCAANESDEMISACAARASACTCLSEVTTVQFLALLPSAFKRLRMASSAELPNCTK